MTEDKTADDLPPDGAPLTQEETNRLLRRLAASESAHLAEHVERLLDHDVEAARHEIRRWWVARLRFQLIDIPGCPR